jgi:methanogenic corrinoid protein MtbC1
MVADALHLYGWRVQYLGANVPTIDLLRHIGLLRPDLVGLSVSFAHQLHIAREVMARLGAAYRTARPPVIVGGLGTRGFDDVALRLGADEWSADAGAAVSKSEELSVHGARA